MNNYLRKMIVSSERTPIFSSSGNAYKKWTQDEDYQLIALYQQGFSIFNLMIEFKRNEGAIKSRIKKLLQK
jgi:hypothetical protein